MTINSDTPMEITKNRFENISEFREALNNKITNSKRVILFFHKSPDFDSVGSNFGFVHYLKQINPNIEVNIVSADKLAKNVSEFTKRLNQEINFIDPALFDYEEEDLTISIDFADISRTTREEGFKLPAKVNQAVIDHHVVPPIEDRINYISKENISSATIIYKIYKDAKMEIPKETFEFLIFGLLGDSGLLRFKDRNFLSSLEIIRDYCEKYGTEGYFEIIEAIEANKPAEELSLQAIFLKNYNFKRDGKYMYTSITLKEREEAGIPSDYADITNGAMLIRNYEGALFTFSISEDKYESNKFNISFRACTGSNFEVRSIAEKLGGGGHPAAAGVQIVALDMNDAISKVEEAILVVTAKS